MRLRKIFYFLLLLSALPSAVYAQLPNNQPEQDCINALPICSDTFTQVNTYRRWGLDRKEVPTTSCLTSNENNSVWYIFNTYTPGYLAFSITPLSSGDDYDFALYDITGHSCSDIYTGVAPEVRCNFAITIGIATGIGCNHTCHCTSSSPQQALPFVDSLPVNAGQTFALVIDNYNGNSTQGYKIDFRCGTASIVANSASQLDSVSVGSCGPTDTINVFFEKPVLNSSISATGDNFYITPPAGVGAVNIASAKSLSPSGRYTDGVTLFLQSSITIKGNYIIGPKNGANGEINDICNHPVAPTTVTYIQKAYAVPNFTEIGLPGCNLDTADFVNTSDPLQNPTSYTWSLGDGTGTSTAVDSFKYLYGAQGNYTVTLVASSSDCVDSVKHPVTIGHTPFHLDFTTAPAVLCANAPVQFTDASQPFATQWLWTFDDGQISANHNETHTYTQPGVYNVKLWMSDVTGTCVDSVTKAVTIDSLAKANFSTTPNVVCQGRSVVFLDSSEGKPTQWVWDFGNGTTSNLQSVSVTYDSARTYFISLTVTNQCNSDNLLDTVIVKTTPRFDLGNDTIFCKPDSILLIGYIGGDSTVFSYSLTRITADSIYFKDVVPTPGTDIRAMAFLNGCTYDVTKHVEAQEDGCIEINLPTAFSPNGDGTNDLFRLVHPEKVKSVDIKVYNRWGQLVFQDNRLNFKWDGTFNGAKAPDDVYTWYLLATGLTGQNEFYKGNVTIVR